MIRTYFVKLEKNSLTIKHVSLGSPDGIVYEIFFSPCGQDMLDPEGPTYSVWGLSLFGSRPLSAWEGIFFQVSGPKGIARSFVVYISHLPLWMINKMKGIRPSGKRIVPCSGLGQKG